MTSSKQRIFIKNLPETATKEEIEQIFATYGAIQSIEIKERKDVANLKNLSLFFAYINIEIDDQKLQKCFQDFKQEKWHNQYVELQIAKESFLERLRREREASGQTNAPIEQKPVEEIPKPVQNGLKSQRKAETSSSSDDSTSSDEEENSKPANKNIKKEEKIDFKPEENSDLVIINNKFKKIDKNGLKIESVGKAPIVVIEKKKKPQAGNAKSLLAVTKGSLERQFTIKAALSNIDAKRANKIVFDAEEGHQRRKSIINSNSKKNRLFEGDHSDTETYNFEVKSQFEGEKGQKLLELQSKYKNDSRFKLDQRFVDQEPQNGVGEPEDMSLDEEKRREFEILEQVLGKKLRPPQNNAGSCETKRPGMIRYDPSLPQHSKYEIRSEEQAGSKRKRKHVEEEQEEQQVEPEVSKEVFYQVSDNLKEALQENEGFSLLKMFGRDEEGARKAGGVQDEESTPKKIDSSERNPFRHDSSDDEDEMEAESGEKVPVAPMKMWTEPFFFVEDDFRFQEGRDFVLKMAEITQEIDFGQLRQEIKHVVRSKVRNALKNNKPFRKKLGGNKHRKKNLQFNKKR